MPGIYVTAEAHFDSAHYLPGYKGKCANMHGHRWTIKVTYGPFDTDELDECGIAKDFKIVKGGLKFFAEELDHKVLNEQGFSRPTAEMLAVYLWDYLQVDPKLHEVRVYESPDCYVTVK